MKKDVMIFIRGTQNVDGETGTVEMFTKGSYYKRQGDWYIVYDEAEEGDIRISTRTLLRVEGDRRVTMTRRGKQRSQLIIENGERHQCHYDTGIADWIMGVQGRSITSDLGENGGSLSFRYTLDINTVLSSENEVDIVVKECE